MSSNINYDKLYERYEKLYADAERKAEKLKIPMRLKKYSRESFEHYYKVTKRHYELLKIEGKLSRNTVVDITSKVVNRQRWEVDYKRARAYQQAQINLGMEPTKLREIMRGNADWDFVKERYRELRREGFSGTAAGEIISTDFFYGVS